MCSRRVCVVSFSFCARLHLILTPTVSRQRVRQTCGVVCKMRAFFVSASLICRDRQLASFVVTQGICVVLSGLTSVWRNRWRREGGVSKGGEDCHRCHTRWLAAAERREPENSKDRRRWTIIYFPLFSGSAFVLTTSSLVNSATSYTK